VSPLGIRIVRAAEAAGTTCAGVARDVDISKQYMAHLCAGDVTRSKHLPAIATALGVDLAWLTKGEGTPPIWAVEDWYADCRRLALSTSSSSIAQALAHRHPTPAELDSMLSVAQSVRSQPYTAQERAAIIKGWEAVRGSFQENPMVASTLRASRSDSLDSRLARLETLMVQLLDRLPPKGDPVGDPDSAAVAAIEGHLREVRG
jgi:hypothetical protein